MAPNPCHNGATPIAVGSAVNARRALIHGCRRAKSSSARLAATGASRFWGLHGRSSATVRVPCAHKKTLVRLLEIYKEPVRGLEQNRTPMPIGFTTDPPLITALVTCDNFTQSPIDGKVTFVGLFDDITIVQFPATLPVTAIAVLVGVREQVDLQFFISRWNADMTETATTFGAVSIVLPTPPPQIMNNVIVHAQHIFPNPGRYDLKAYGNGTFLAYKPIILRQLEARPGTNI